MIAMPHIPPQSDAAQKIAWYGEFRRVKVAKASRESGTVGHGHSPGRPVTAVTQLPGAWLDRSQARTRSR